MRKAGLTLGIRSEPGNQETWVLALLTSLLRTMASPSADRSSSQRLHLRIPTAALEAPAFPGPVVTVWSKAFLEGRLAELPKSSRLGHALLQNPLAFGFDLPLWSFLKP